MKLLGRIRRKGFTLVELLVVIAIIGILVSIVLPAINNALFRGRLMAAAANGRSIVQTIIGRETEGIYGGAAQSWPKSGAFNVSNFTFPNSTDYFRFIVTNEWLNVSFGFFAAPGITPAVSATDFTGEKNAWCIVGDISDAYPDTAPALFTRNLGGGGTSFATMNAALTAGTGGVVAQLGDVAPFGRRGFVFVTRGGSSFAPFRDELRVGTFTNLFLRTDASGNTVTNTVLRPGAGL